MNYIFFGKDDDKEQPIRVPAEIKCIPRAIDHFVCNTHSHFLSINESLCDARATCINSIFIFAHNHICTTYTTEIILVNQRTTMKNMSRE